MMRGAVIALLMAMTAWAGCIEEATDGAAMTDGPVAADGGDGSTLDVLMGPPTLGPPFDPWEGNVTELELWSGTVTAATLNTEAACLGCARLAIPSPVPEGTGFLRVEGDASAATRPTGWYVQVDQTRGRTFHDHRQDLVGAHSDADQATWRFPLGPVDWDPPHAHPGWAALTFWASETSGAYTVLDGPIKVRVVAERDPDWTPLPRPDAWHARSGHTSPSEGVVTLTDQNVSITSPDLLACQTAKCSATTVRFERAVPDGAEQIAVAMILADMAGCRTDGECSARGGLRSGSRSTNIFHAIVNDVGPHHRILVYDVGDHVTVDGPYVPEPLTSQNVWLDDCTPGLRDAMNENCLAGDVQGLEATVRYVAEAWKGPVDVDGFKRRLGV